MLKRTASISSSGGVLAMSVRVNESGIQDGGDRLRRRFTIVHSTTCRELEHTQSLLNRNARERFPLHLTTQSAVRTWLKALLSSLDNGAASLALEKLTFTRASLPLTRIRISLASSGVFPPREANRCTSRRGLSIPLQLLVTLATFVSLRHKGFGVSSAA